MMVTSRCVGACNGVRSAFHSCHAEPPAHPSSGGGVTGREASRFGRNSREPPAHHPQPLSKCAPSAAVHLRQDIREIKVAQWIVWSLNRCQCPCPWRTSRRRMASRQLAEASYHFESRRRDPPPGLGSEALIFRPARPTTTKHTQHTGTLHSSTSKQGAG